MFTHVHLPEHSRLCTFRWHLDAGVCEPDPRAGALDSIAGTAISPNFPPSYRNAPEVTLRLPDGRARKFLVTNVAGTTALELTSNGDWLP